MNSNGSWILEIDPNVLKAARKIPHRDASRISEIIHSLPQNPYGGDVEKMKGGDNTWRRRIGAYRIFYKLLIRERRILVFHLERRTSSTYHH